MENRYYVSYGWYSNGLYRLSSEEVEIEFESEPSPGMLAEMLEGKLAEIYDNYTLVIINYWKL